MDCIVGRKLGKLLLKLGRRLRRLRGNRQEALGPSDYMYLMWMCGIVGVSGVGGWVVR